MTPMMASTEVPFLDLAGAHDDMLPALQAAWREIVATGQFVGGTHVDQFEHAWADHCGARHAVGVGNGTDALHLVLRALGIGPGDEVLVPANTFIATAEAVLLCGATFRFVDVDPDSLLLTPEVVSHALTARTAAVVAVHLYGNVCDMDGITTVARRAGIAVIEDAAQAHGARWRGRHVGTLGTAGCFSFYPGKTLGAFGDAGAVISNDAALVARVRSLGNHGRAPNDAHEHRMAGTNSRLDAFQAAVLLAKLPHLDDWVQARARVVEGCRAALTGTGVRAPVAHPHAHPAWHLNVVRLRNRNLARRALGQRGINTAVHYPVPCHRQRPYEPEPAVVLPVAERAAREVLSLPLWPQMSAGQFRHLRDSLNTVLDHETAS